MSKPDWTEAPDDATHWDTRGAVWCKHLYFWCYGRWNYEGEIHDLAEDRYTPRPVEAWFPIVGERCQVIELPGIYIECEILANRCGDYIYYVPEKHTYGMLAAGAFRPIRTQAKTEPATTAWDGTGLPPVGTVCEGVWLKMPGVGDRDFEGVIVKGYYKKQVWFCATSGEDITQLTENVYFRPIRNRREELEDLLTRASETGLTVKSLAGFIIARGYRLER